MDAPTIAPRNRAAAEPLGCVMPRPGKPSPFRNKYQQNATILRLTYHMHRGMVYMCQDWHEAVQQC